MLFYNEEIKKKFTEDERLYVCIQILYEEWSNYLNQFFNIHKLFELKKYTKLNVQLIDNEKYRDYVRSCLELRVEYMYKLV